MPTRLGASRREPTRTMALRTPRRYAHLIPDAIAKRIGETDENGCWPWQGTPNHEGYGRWGQRLAHRVVWQLVHGPIPVGRILHHTCENRICVNPGHLELTTRSKHPD